MGFALDLLTPLAFQDQRIPSKHTVFLKLFTSGPSQRVNEHFSPVSNVAVQ
jgi:hypothetical protein